MAYCTNYPACKAEVGFGLCRRCFKIAMGRGDDACDHSMRFAGEYRLKCHKCGGVWKQDVGKWEAAA